MSAAPALPPTAEATGGRAPVAKGLVVALMAYWAAFAAVAPVINFDSQTYNLGRLYIAHEKGLFGNHRWNSLRQIIFPWTFDAVHYPFLFLHWGYNLPSFACFLGLLVIVFRLVAAAASVRAAWWGCLALLALPTVVLQAVCTKNDIPVIFGVACWFYAWTLWRAERLDRYLVFMALALSFAAGAKTTGLPLYAILGGWTWWQLRASRPSALRFAGWMALGLLLLGSTEIYLNNQRLFHAPMGERDFIRHHQNGDGVSGAVANFVRYVVGDLNVGIDAANPASPVSGFLEDACRELLHFLGLTDVGYRTGYGEGDASLRFFKVGSESGADYGPVGAAAMLASLGFVLARRPSDGVWKLAASGVATLALTSFTVGWMPWNARFLMLSFCLFTLALTLATFRLADTGWGRFARSLFRVATVYSALVYPWCSFNKKPADLWEAVAHRPRYEMKDRPGMLEIVRDLRARAGAIGPSAVLLHAGDDSWVVCFLELRAPEVVSAPVVNRWSLVVNSLRHERERALPVYVLTVNQPVDPAVAPLLTLVKKYQEPNSALYVWRPPTEAGRGFRDRR